MIVLLIQHRESERKITVRANQDLTIQTLIDDVVEKLGLKKYEPYTLRRLNYSLKLVEKDGKTKDLPKDKPLSDQLRDGNNLILEVSGTESPISNSEFGVATISVGGSWSVRQLQGLLGNLDYTYSALFAFNEIILDSGSEEHGRYANDLSRRHEYIVGNMGSYEQLRVSRVNINSPGIIEIIGALNPLETIRQFLKDHREAKLANEKMHDEKEKAKNYGNAIEQAKATLEIETLKNNVIKERMAVLKDAGFTQEELRPYAINFLEKPLNDLLIFQERKQVDITAVMSLGIQHIEIVRDKLLSPPSS